MSVTLPDPTTPSPELRLLNTHAGVTVQAPLLAAARARLARALADRTLDPEQPEVCRAACLGVLVQLNADELWEQAPATQSTTHLERILASNGNCCAGVARAALDALRSAVESVDGGDSGVWWPTYQDQLAVVQEIAVIVECAVNGPAAAAHPGVGPVAAVGQHGNPATPPVTPHVHVVSEDSTGLLRINGQPVPIADGRHKQPRLSTRRAEGRALRALARGEPVELTNKAPSKLRSVLRPLGLDLVQRNGAWATVPRDPSRPACLKWKDADDANRRGPPQASGAKGP